MDWLVERDSWGELARKEQGRIAEGFEISFTGALELNRPDFASPLWMGATE